MSRIPRDPRHDVVLADVIEKVYKDNPYDGSAGYQLCPTREREIDDTLYNQAHTYQMFELEFSTFVTAIEVWVYGNGIEWGTFHLWKQEIDVTNPSEAGPPYISNVVDYDAPTSAVHKVTIPLNELFVAGKYTFWFSFFTPVTTTPIPQLLACSYVQGMGATYNGNGPDMSNQSLYFQIKSDAEDAPVLDSLGVQLTERDVLGYAANWQSPFAGQLGQGALKEQDLTSYKVLSQNDWRGGRGQQNAYQHPTARFLDALADTRFSEMVVLPPMPTRTVLDTGSVPDFTPSPTQGFNRGYAFIDGTGAQSGNELAQSFTVGASGFSLTQLRLKIEKDTAQGSWALTVQICADDGGAPGSVVGTLTLPSTTEYDSTVGNPKYASFTGTIALSAATTYWIKPTLTVTGNLSSAGFYWHDGGATAYAGGAGAARIMTAGTWGAWAATAVDFAFICNMGSALPADITVQPVEFANNWYCASGTGIYKFTAGEWTQAANIGTAITALAVLGGTMYAALGDSANMQSSTNGTTWAAISGRAYTYLRAYNGYLYLAKATGGANALAYYNGTNWTNLTIGSSSVIPTGIVGFSNQIIITTTSGLYSISTDYVYQILDYSSQRSATNGVGAIVWAGSGLLYVPVRNSLLAYNGQTTTQAGLDLDTGLPVGEQGRISAMVSTANWLFAAVDAGAGRSSIYAYNGGWHCLVKAASNGTRIRAMGIEAVTGATARLWYAEGMDWYYLDIPETTDNPSLYAGSKYQDTGYVISSRWLGELSGIEKDFQSVIVRSEQCSTGQTVEVWIEVDRSGYWWYVGNITRSPVQELELSAPAMANKTTAGGSTSTSIVVDGTSTLADMNVGGFVRIGREVRQVATIPSATTFTLNRELEDGAPAAGTTIYTSRPAGREISIRAVLRTDDSTKTPKLLSYSIRYMEQLMDKARLTIQIPVADKIAWRNGAREPLTGKQLYRALVEYGKRITPFWILTPDGEEIRVKCSGSMTWSGIARTATAEKNQTVKGTLTMQLMEV